MTTPTPDISICQWCEEAPAIRTWTDEHNGECSVCADCDDEADEEMAELISYCPACGSPIDYCQGHGEMGDPAGFAILEAHDNGQHADCHPGGCDEADAR